MAAVVGVDCYSLAGVGIVLIAAVVAVVHPPPYHCHGGDNVYHRCCRCKGGSGMGHSPPPWQEWGNGGGGEWGGE